MPISMIAGNWKMNSTVQEAHDLVLAMKGPLEATKGVEAVVCPPYVWLLAVYELLKDTSVAVGAQNMHHEDGGAFTGEISPAMLVGLCQYVILGHSERRDLMGETDAMVNAKAKAALKAGLRPIVCVGEHLDDREGGSAEAFVESQIRASLADIESADDLVVAYEPIWAIGTGRAATPEIAQTMVSHIRGVLASIFGSNAASDVPILYGGSVNPGNISDYMRERDVNGALVGGASLNAETFVEIVQRAAAVQS